jgi:hypothetical protein
MLLIWATEITIVDGTMQEAQEFATITADGSEIADLVEIQSEKLRMDLVSGHVNMLRSQLETYSQKEQISFK